MRTWTVVVEGTLYASDRSSGTAAKVAFSASLDVRAADPARGDLDAADRAKLTEATAAFLRRARIAPGETGAAVLARIGAPTMRELEEIGVACDAIRSLELRAAEPSALRVGLHVSAEWTNGSYYGATIVEIAGDRCLAKWDDGAEPTWVPRDRVRLEPPPVQADQLAVGMEVSAQWTDGGFYRATIGEIAGGSFLVRWLDGAPPTWVKPEQIRLPGRAPMPPSILAPGMRVLAAWSDGKMHPATVRALKDGRVEVAWDGSDTTSWLLPVQITPA